MTYIKNKLSSPAIQRWYPFFLFALLGIFNMFCSFAIFTVFWKLLHINYLFAISCTYVISAAIQFFGNRKMTFKCSTGSLPLQIFKYLVLLLINYLVTMFIVHAVVAVLHLSPYIGMLIATACTAIIGYSLFKLWIFRANSNI